MVLIILELELNFDYEIGNVWIVFGNVGIVCVLIKFLFVFNFYVWCEFMGKFVV